LAAERALLPLDEPLLDAAVMVHVLALRIGGPRHSVADTKGLEADWALAISAAAGSVLIDLAVIIDPWYCSLIQSISGIIVRRCCYHRWRCRPQGFTNVIVVVDQLVHEPALHGGIPTQLEFVGIVGGCRRQGFKPSELKSPVPPAPAQYARRENDQHDEHKRHGRR
jgi:hypothetical protein